MRSGSASAAAGDVSASATRRSAARRVLRYGQTVRLGRRLSCTSRRAGLTCRNLAGHGFFLSRDRIRLY